MAVSALLVVGAREKGGADGGEALQADLRVFYMIAMAVGERRVSDHILEALRRVTNRVGGAHGWCRQWTEKHGFYGTFERSVLLKRPVREGRVGAGGK